MARPLPALRLAISCIVLCCGAARAEMPYPSNPLPCTGSETDPPCIDATAFAQYLFLPTTEPLTLPNDFGNDNWKYTSERTGDPAIDNSAQELFGVKGASIDRAWQITTGRPDVLIAVIDSGIRWAEPQRDLVNKFYLNRGELPVPEGSTNTRDPYDRNGDGLFTIPDYLADGTQPQDARVSDQNGNGMIDPEDLIFLFSDGVDGDANGYIDDISGWDFFEDDNDALDEVRYGHGTGESHDSGNEANNGLDDTGVCPNCLLLEVRAGDSFVADVNAFAQGVVFAVDSGARVVQEALGTLNQTQFGQAAVDYAYRNGVVVIASAADEESNHHNYPANYDHTVQVNSVTRFADISGIKQSPPSYLYLNGCTNYGGHIALAVPSSSCSSEATGRSAGMAALVISAALNAIDRGTLTPYPRDDGEPAPFPLSADEIKQILIGTADDINFDARPEAKPPLPQNYTTTLAVPGVAGSERYHSTAGWDQFFGYGRVNADQAVRRVADGRIPPEAAIDAPAWYATLDPQRTPSLSLSGRAAANRAGAFSYVVDVAPGIQPAEVDFAIARAVEGRSAAVQGELATIDLAALRERMPNGIEGAALTPDGKPDPDRFTFTIRLRVMDDLGNVAEDRRVLALHRDPDLLPAFPRQLGADGAAAPSTADIDADGREEIIIASSNGQVHALRADGSELPGWPVASDPLELHDTAPGYASGAVPSPVSSAIVGAVAVGDLDRDGTLEVVATDVQGKAYVWGPDGVRRTGFPVSTRPEYSFSRRSERNLATPEGLVPDRVNRHNRDNRLGRALASGPALGNLDGSSDGSLEIVAGSFDRHLYAWRHDGTPVPGWPVLLKDPTKVESVDPVTNEVTLKADANGLMGTKILVPPSLGDLDGDGDLEVLAAVNEEYREEPNALFTNPLIALFRLVGVIDPGNTRVYAVHADGAAHGAAPLARGWNPDAFVPGWPVKTALITTELLPTVGTGSNGPPALADVDGDGQLEVATMSAVGPAYVFTADGVSYLGRHPTGEDRTFATDPLGADSDGIDGTTFGSLGATVLAELDGFGRGFYLLAPTAGLGRLVDAQAPARQFPAENHLSAWPVSQLDGSPADGALARAFPRVVNDLQFLAGPAVADIDGDGLAEAIQGSGVYDVHAVNIDGREPTGWPKFTNGWMVGSPAVGDLDGDGQLEVVGVTREGWLFAWRTTGRECGAIPWRRYHHDEWGTGNVHTDARPPASLRPTDIAVTALTASRARLNLAAVPGDDLFCGNADLDVRFATAPIANATDFAAATPVESVATVLAGRRIASVVSVNDSRFAGQLLYFAVAATDDAGNRSAPAGSQAVQFPGAPTPTTEPTATATETVSPAPSSTATVTPTASPVSTATPAPTATAIAPTATATNAPPATAVPSPTATVHRGSADDGCHVGPPPQSPAPWWLLPFVLFGAARRVRRREGRRF